MYNQINNILSVEQTPPPLNTTKLRILPRLIEILKVEVSSPVRVRLTHKRVQERLQVVNRSKRRSIVRVPGVTRLGRPTGFSDEHFRLVGQVVRNVDVGLLEEVGCPAGCLINGHVGEPWVDV